MSLDPRGLGRIRDRLTGMEAALAPAGDGVLAFDLDLRYLYWGPRMEELSGLPAAEVLGRVVTDVFPALRRVGELLHLEAALRGESSVVKGRAFALARDGQAGDFDGFYSPLHDDGEIVGGVAVIRDVTEDKRATELLRETELRFQNMADASPVMLWMSGTDSLCTFFNQTWLFFTGRSLAEEWGIGWAEGVHFEDLSRVLDTYEAAFCARRAFEMEYRLRRHDGELRWILDRGAPRYTPDGTFAGFIGSCTDITERRCLEDDLRRAVQARDDFIAVASHELRTPLTPIQLAVQSLVRKARRGGEGAGYAAQLEQLDRYVERQVALLEDLLDISRITVRPLPLASERLDVAAVVREVAAFFSADAILAGSELQVAVDGPVWGRWDRARLERVVRNLVSNALKYGRGHPVDVALSADDGHVRLTVRDHGIGIASADRARIFERFERAVTPRPVGGSGLGLWITRKAVNLMGGTITVDSQLGEGSTFLVELPREPGAVVDQERS